VEQSAQSSRADYIRGALWESFMKSSFRGCALVFAFCAAAAMLPETSMAATNGQAASAKQDSKTFVNKATIAGMFEVKSSEIAKDKSNNPEIKKFAERMIKDHTKANKELRGLVEAGKVKGVSQVPSALDKAHAINVERLKSASRSEFDQFYRGMQVAGHTEAVALFSKEAKSGQDAELKSWASQTLPILKEHLTEIQAIDLFHSSASRSNK
jgi:putative membrane protein